MLRNYVHKHSVQIWQKSRKPESTTTRCRMGWPPCCVNATIACHVAPHINTWAQHLAWSQVYTYYGHQACNRPFRLQVIHEKLWLWTTAWYTWMIFILNIYQQYPQASSSKLHTFCNRWFSTCSLHILLPCYRRTAYGEVRNSCGHMVWRHGQSPSRPTFHSAFHLPHCRILPIPSSQG